MGGFVSYKFYGERVLLQILSYLIQETIVKDVKIELTKSSSEVFFPEDEIDSKKCLFGKDYQTSQNY